jgi:FixJ family two-component response regulator
MRLDKYLSKTERRVFDVVAQSVTLKEAALKLGIEPQTLYNFFYNLRRKYDKCRGWVNAIEAQKRRSRLLRLALTPREKLLTAEAWELGGE